MSAFTFRVEGDCPSWNHSYRDVVIRTKTGKTYRSRAKTEAATAYQLLVTLRAKEAAPPNWTASGQIRVTYAFYFKRNRDADNALKMLNDAVAKALDVNDSLFLPCVLSKTTGNKEPYVEVTVAAVEP